MYRFAAPWFVVSLWAVCLWHGLPGRARAIEGGLFARCAALLSAAGLPTAGLRVDGRDVWLSGAKASPQVSDTAIDLLHSVSGVRKVHVTYVAEAAPAPAPRPSVQARLTALLSARPLTFMAPGSVLTDESRRVLNEVASALNEAPSLAVTIEGAGPTLEIGRRRALSVRQYLIGRGLVASRFAARGRATGTGIAFRLQEAPSR
jgi:outer membrane protein OmpA-like peptidoglycan-associated protein